MNLSCQATVTLKLLDLYPDCWTLVEYMWGYVIPVLATLIIIINCLIVSVFAKPHVRSHTTLILTLIACSDTLNIVFPAISYIYHYTSGRFKDYLSYSSCFWTYIFADVFVNMFNMISLWLTVLLAYIRCRCLRSPFNSRHIHSRKSMLIYLTVILLLAVVVHLPPFFLFEFTPVLVEDNNTVSTKVACGISESHNVLFKPCMGRKIHILMETVIDSVLPCVILVCCNISILNTLHKAQRERSSLRCHGYTSGAERKSRDTEKDSSPVPDDHDVLSEVTEIEIKTSGNKYLYASEFRLKKLMGKCGINNGINETKQGSRRYVDINECRDLFRKKTKRQHSEIDKLDRESRRTTWLIFVIASMILLHEIPVVVTNIINLVIHAEDQLPLNFYGCFSVLLSVWQYITYPVIFMIYACMSGSFRAELMNTVTSCCKRYDTSPTSTDSKKMFVSPCSVRKSLSRDKFELNYDFDTDS